MTDNEIPPSKSLAARIDEEILRMSDRAVTGPPENPNPMTLAEYTAEMHEIPRPTDVQIHNLIRALEENRDLLRSAQPGFKIVPLLMTHDHGFSEFTFPRRIQTRGYLYVYLLNEDGLTALPSNIANMKAILPPEIIQNGVTVPKNLASDPKIQGEFFLALHSAIAKMLRMTGK